MTSYSLKFLCSFMCIYIYKILSCGYIYNFPEKDTCYILFIKITLSLVITTELYNQTSYILVIFPKEC